MLDSIFLLVIVHITPRLRLWLSCNSCSFTETMSMNPATAHPSPHIHLPAPLPKSIAA
jgi:hypothetical protein